MHGPSVFSFLTPGVLIAHRYRLLSPLGAGSQGTVWLAEDSQQPEHPCALKLSARGGLHAETEALLRIDHPALARVLDHGPWERGDFISLEHVQGSALSHEHSVTAIIHAASSVASALSALHDLGIVHGDVKPANILVSQGGAVLVDLGLSSRACRPDSPAGTLAFMAPEALAAERTAASDLWALGITLCLVLTRKHPFALVPDDRDSLLTALARRAEPAASVLDLLPAALRPSIASLLAHDPERRPEARAFAHRWLRDASAITHEPAPIGPGGPVPRHGRAPLTGRERERDELLHTLDLSLHGSLLGAVLIGPPGVGKRRLIDESLRALKIKRAPSRDAPEVLDALPEVIRRPTLVRILDAPPEHILFVARAIARLRRFGASSPPVTLLASSVESVSDPELRAIFLQPLDRVSTHHLLKALHGQELKPHSLDAWLDVTAGLPGRVVTLAQSLGTERLALVSREALAERAAELHREALPDELSPAAREAAITLRVAEEPLEFTVLAAALQQNPRPLVSELTRRGVALASDSSAWLTAPFSLDDIPLGQRTRLADSLASALEALRPERASARASASLHALHPEAAERCVRAANAPGVNRASAILWLERGAPFSLDRAAYDLALARALVLSGDPARALAVLSPHPRTAASRAVEADALRRAGDPDGARALARALRHDPDPDARAVGQMVMARDCLDRGDAEGAREALGEPLADGVGVLGPLRVRALEVGAMVALAQHDLQRATERLARADSASLRSGDGVARARVRSLQGMVCQRRGQHTESRRLYEDALSLATQEGDVLGAATYLLNLGGAQLECGALGEAARCIEGATQMLASGHRLSELARALANLASLRDFLGDRPGAAEAARKAADAARLACDAVTEGFARTLEVGATLEGPEAADALEEAATRLDQGGDPSRAQDARARAAAKLVTLDPERAARMLASGSGTALSSLVRAELACQTRPAERALIEARVAEARSAVEGDPSVEHELWLLKLDALAAEALGRREEALRTHARRRARVEALATTLPDAVAGLFIEAHAPAPRKEPPSRTDTEGAWRRLAEITRKMNGEARLRPLLELVMDSVIELTGAARGFLLLREANGALKIRTARNIGQRDLEGDETLFSRSVAERVMREGEALVTLDASADGRLEAFASVHAMRLRSILAVPLRLGGESVGTIYLDDRYRAAAFGELSLELARAFADSAAVAIQNARTQTELRHALARAEKLTQELTRTVDAQRVEIEVTRATRGRHEAIVGQGAAMSRTLALVDRIAPTSMPVLLQGESGTGKELIARTLHASSPRGARAFVAENCSAIPETLLESVLFGHVKGAFTGADRNRAGLFEVADGGTLLLDEIGEMSPAMQSRLLRVLQEGEVRPVGGNHSRKVDVRIIAATHRNLAEMVRLGTFREDLYYRLAVMVLPVASLRERREDIPELVAYFLARCCPAGTAIDRRAMAILVGAPWPGNVRQLQNEIQRAGALCDGTIREEHLSPEHPRGFAGSPGAAAPESQGSAGREGREGHGGAGGGAQGLKTAVEDVERSLVERSLREHKGNQSRAAKALGLSRFGLQKKLKRLGINAREMVEGRRD